MPNTPPFPSIPHETLWDVDHWNAYVAKHGGLPYLVADKPTSIVGTPHFANRLWLNMFRGPMQNPHGSLKVAHFHRALRPHPLILEAAARAMPPKPYGAIHLRLEDDLQGYAAFMRDRLGVKTNFELMAGTFVPKNPKWNTKFDETRDLEACAARTTELYVAVGLEAVSNKEDKELLLAKKGPFSTTLVFKDGGDIARRFGANAASSVGAIVDTEILADAAYYVGYAGLSTFDRTLVDIRATRDQYDARMATPDNCTFTVGKNRQRGVVEVRADLPAGRLWMRHFQSFP